MLLSLSKVNTEVLNYLKEKNYQDLAFLPGFFQITLPLKKIHA